jgi:hypothetical protein
MIEDRPHPYKSARVLAWRNLTVSAINAGLEQDLGPVPTALAEKLPQVGGKHSLAAGDGSELRRCSASPSWAACS